MKLGKHYVAKVSKIKYTQRSWSRAAKRWNKNKAVKLPVEEKQDNLKQNETVSLEDMVLLFEIIFCTLFMLFLIYLRFKSE